jgi:hypothetical protein
LTGFDNNPVLLNGFASEQGLTGFDNNPVLLNGFASEQGLTGFDNNPVLLKGMGLPVPKITCLREGFSP